VRVIRWCSRSLTSTTNRFSGSRYITSNDTMIVDKTELEGMEGSGRGQGRNAVPAFA
jgi:hypothetical protein